MPEQQENKYMSLVSAGRDLVNKISIKTRFIQSPSGPEKSCSDDTVLDDSPALEYHLKGLIRSLQELNDSLSV